MRTDAVGSPATAEGHDAVAFAEKAELERRVERLGRMLLCSRIREGRGPQQQPEATASRGSMRSASLDSGVRACLLLNAMSRVLHGSCRQSRPVMFRTDAHGCQHLQSP